MKLYLLTLLVAATLAACHASPDNSYYILQPVPAKTPAFVPQNWSLGKLTIPGLLDRPQIVLKSGDNGVRMLEYDRWAEPFDSMAARVLKEDLQSRLGVSAPAPAQNQLSVIIDEFDADTQNKVTLKATWLQHSTAAETKHLFEKSEPAVGAGPSAIAASMSRLLSELADAMAAGS